MPKIFKNIYIIENKWINDICQYNVYWLDDILNKIDKDLNIIHPQNYSRMKTIAQIKKKLYCLK